MKAADLAAFAHCSLKRPANVCFVPQADIALRFARGQSQCRAESFRGSRRTVEA
jgi:hypothetical protein